MMIVHDSVVELLKCNNNFALLDLIQEGDLVLLERVEPYEGMKISDFDAISSTDPGIIILLKEIDPTNPIDINNKEKYICMRSNIWDQLKKKKQLTLDILSFKR